MAGELALPLRDRTGTIIAFAVIDADQAHLLSDRWHLHGDSRPTGRLYARRVDGAFLHRVVFGVSPLPGFVIDHINGLPLDNRRANLRVATIAENAQNVRRRAVPKASRYRNVTWNRHHRRWQAYVKVDGVGRVLGRFVDEDEAGAVAEQFRRQHLPFSPRGEMSDVELEALVARAQARPRLPKVPCPECGQPVRPCNLAKHEAAHSTAATAAAWRASLGRGLSSKGRV